MQWWWESNIVNIFVMERKSYAHSRLRRRARTTRSKASRSTKDYPPSMWSTLLKLRNRISPRTRWYKDMRKDIFGQDFLIGITRTIVLKDVFSQLFGRNIKHQKLKVKSLCMVYKSLKSKVLYYQQNR